MDVRKRYLAEAIIFLENTLEGDTWTKSAADLDIMLRTWKLIKDMRALYNDIP